MAQASNTPAVKENATVKRITPYQQMIRAMANDATVDNAEYNGDDLNAILEADSEEALFESDNRPPLNFQHLAGCEIAILDVHVKYSRGGGAGYDTVFQTEDGKKMYVLARCVRLSDTGDNKRLLNLPEIGQEFEANTSARYLVTKMWRALTLGLIDPDTGKQWECAVESTDLGDGQAVLKFRPIPKRSVSA